MVPESRKAFSDSSIRRSRHPAPNAYVRSVTSLFPKQGYRERKLVKRSLTMLSASGCLLCSTKLQICRRVSFFPCTLIVMRAGSAGLHSPDRQNFTAIQKASQASITRAFLTRQRSYSISSGAMGQTAGGSSLPFPVRKSSFMRAIAFVMASGL